MLDFVTVLLGEATSQDPAQRYLSISNVYLRDATSTFHSTDTRRRRPPARGRAGSPPQAQGALARPGAAPLQPRRGRGADRRLHRAHSPASVLRDLERWEGRGLEGLADGTVPGNPPRITEKARAFMEQRLSEEEERIWNASQLAEAVEERFGVGESPEAIRQHLLAMGYRWKRTRYVLSRPPDPEEERKARGELEELKKEPKRENCSLLVAHRTLVAQSRMQPASVVKPFQVLEDGTPCRLSIGEAAPMHEEFGLQGGDEALRHGVIQSGSGPSHRRGGADLFEALAERDSRVLDAAIRMMHEAGDRSASPYCHLQASTTSSVLM